jgi:DNA-binding XRE family transcriptional regulator
MSYDIAEAQRILSDAEVFYPAAVADAILAGATPLAAWRTYRGMSQAALAQAAGLTQAAVARLEAKHIGKVPQGRLKTRRALARVLDIDTSALDPLED